MEEGSSDASGNEGAASVVRVSTNASEGLMAAQVEHVGSKLFTLNVFLLFLL